MAARPLKRLGQLPVAQFLARYWQRRPLLIRQALPGFVSPLAPEELFDLAGRHEAESRLIEHVGRQWLLAQGPLPRRRMPPLRRRGWTLLVQGVDHHLAWAHELLARFRFVPDARLDDLMVSYASSGGGVGPHTDSYDVFLLQALGRRRWRIQTRPDTTCRDGLPIRQLARFRPEQQWVLEPGDMLYLPPGVAHDGVAVGGGCMTFSIGFRSPSWPDLAAIWAEMQADGRGNRGATLRDAGSDASAHPALLPPTMVDQAHRQMLRRQPRRADVALALLRHLSEPKPRVVFDPPAHPLPLRAFTAVLMRAGVRLDARTRMLYSNRTIAINGEMIDDMPVEALAPLRALADRRMLSAPRGMRLDGEQGGLLQRMYEWYLAGWVHPQI